MDHVNYSAKRGHGTAALRDAALQDRALPVRSDHLPPFNGQPANAVVGAQLAQICRVLKTELLPPEILNDPRFWDEAPNDNPSDHMVDSALKYLRLGGSEKTVDPFRYRC